MQSKNFLNNPHIKVKQPDQQYFSDVRVLALICGSLLQISNITLCA